MSPAPGPVSATVRPRASTVVVLSLAVGASLAPSVLPRPAVLQGLLTGVLLGLGLLVDTLLTRALVGRGRQPARHSGWWALLLGAGVVMVLTVWADGVLGRARQVTGLSAPTPTYWAVAAGVGLLVCLVPVALGGMLRRALTAAPGRRGRARSAVAVLLALVVGMTQLQGVDRWLLPASSGDIGMAEEKPVGAGVRVYVGLDEAATPGKRAALAVERLEQAGGLDRRAVLVAVPTGSGWVNPEAVAGLEAATGGDLATVAVQGGSAPSWVELVLRRADHEAAAGAVLEAVTARVRAMPESERPRVYLLGESLGALVGRTLLRKEGSVGEEVCGAVWAGVPGGVSAASPAEQVHGNSDDPDVFWRPELLVRQPGTWPAPVWLPGVSYLGVTLDLLASLGPPPGHGHVYGPEQDWKLPESCRA